MLDWPSLVVAFSIGLFGGVHCIGMCGGIMGALTIGISVEDYRKRLLFVIFYNLGRVTSYILIAWVFYKFIDNLQQYFALYFMRYIAGLLLIATGLYTANWWRGLLYLEKVGAYLWHFIRPLSQLLLPVNHYSQAFFLGIIWGWLPCGLIYTALAYATAADTIINAVSIMFAFAVGTLPTVTASSLLAERLLTFIKYFYIRQFFIILIVVFGFWTLFDAYQHTIHMNNTVVFSI